MVEGLSGKIRKIRKDKGLTLEALAKKVGSSKSYIWQIETDTKINPSAQLIAKIAEVLDVTVDYLVREEKVEMAENDEHAIFFRNFQGLDENTKKGIMAQIKELKRLQNQKNDK